MIVSSPPRAWSSMLCPASPYTIRPNMANADIVSFPPMDQSRRLPVTSPNTKEVAWRKGRVDGLTLPPHMVHEVSIEISDVAHCTLSNVQLGGSKHRC